MHGAGCSLNASSFRWLEKEEQRGRYAFQFAPEEVAYKSNHVIEREDLQALDAAD